MSLSSPLMTIFLLIFVGILCCKKKIFNKSHLDGFEILLFRIIMPSYLFSATYKHDLSSLFNIPYIAAYLITFAILAMIATLFCIRTMRREVVCIRILASGYINTAMYALPVITILLKDPTAAIIGNIVQVVIIQPIFISYLNSIHHADSSIIKKIIAILVNPVIIMPIIGITLNALHIPLPEPVVTALTQVGSGTASIALLAFGFTVGATTITKKCLTFNLLSLVCAKNILHPLIALCVAYVMKLDSYWFLSLIIATSAPTAFVVYLISKQFSVEEHLLKQAVTLSSMISIISLIFIAMCVK